MTTQQTVKPSLFALLFANQKSPVNSVTSKEKDSTEPKKFASVFSALFSRQTMQDGVLLNGERQKSKSLFNAAAEVRGKGVKQEKANKPGISSIDQPAGVCMPVHVPGQALPAAEPHNSSSVLYRQDAVKHRNVLGNSKAGTRGRKDGGEKMPMQQPAASHQHDPVLNKQSVMSGLQGTHQNTATPNNSAVTNPAVQTKIFENRAKPTADGPANTKSVQKDNAGVVTLKPPSPEEAYKAFKEQRPETSGHNIVLQKNQSGSFSKEALLSGSGKDSAGLNKTSDSPAGKPGVSEMKIEPAMQKAGSDLDSSLSMGKPLVQGGTLTAGAENTNMKTIAVDRPFVTELAATIVEMRQEQEPKLTVLLNPPSLGRMEIELTQTKDGIEARLLVENQDVKDLIESSISDMKDAVSRQGVILRDVSIEMNLNQPGNRESQNHMFKNRFGQNQHQQGRSGSHADESHDDSSEDKPRERYFGYNSMEITV